MKKMAFKKVLLTGFCVMLMATVLTACGQEAPEYWLGEALDVTEIESTLWSLSEDGLLLDEDEAVISIAPSGEALLVVNVDPEIDLMNLRPPGNMTGRNVRYLSLYVKEGERFIRSGRVYIDQSEGYLFNDVIISSDETGIAWHEGETQILLSTSALSKISSPSGITGGFSSLFLIDFASDEILDLTGGYLEPVDLITQGGHSDHLPQWIDDERISFIRYEFTNRITISLILMDIHTGEELEVVDLTLRDQDLIVSSYVMLEDDVYFTNMLGDRETTGFFKMSRTLDQPEPTLLFSFLDFDENEHVNINHFISVEVSNDGYWALLTIWDPRIIARDIPLAVEALPLDPNQSDPFLSQPDPSTATSLRTGEAWTAYHNVVLFDLINNERVDPFLDPALSPTDVIITAATFSPDGNSLLISVFGDGDLWTFESFDELSLWQVRLTDEDFESNRIFRGEVYHSLAMTQISWFENQSLWIRPTGFALPSYSSREAFDFYFIPAAFESIIP